MEKTESGTKAGRCGETLRQRVLRHALTQSVARQKGLEPLAYCLEGSCSIQLSYWRIFWPAHILERVMGIEPTRPAWKAGVLPLNYTRAFCDGIYYST